MICNNKCNLLTQFVTSTIFSVLAVMCIFIFTSEYCLAESISVDQPSKSNDVGFPFQKLNTLTLEAPPQKAADPNYQCMRCHEKRKRKIPKIVVTGAHNQSPNSSKCVSCHGKKGRHPLRNSTMINFTSYTTTSVSVQNGQCFECHSVAEIRAKEWTHEMHVEQPSCAACHQLHSDSDPMRGVTNKPRISLCLSCHQKNTADQQQAKVSSGSENNAQKSKANSNNQSKGSQSKGHD